ncbi:MAG: ABC transporter substrate-binding protein [Nocardioidaceae bacterium]
MSDDMVAQRHLPKALDNRHALTRRQVLRYLGAAGAAIPLASVLAACGGASDGTSDSSEADVGLLTWRVGALVHLDSARALDNGSKSVQALVTESLVTLDDDLAIAPWLAESWEQVDPVTYTYKLRPGVTFWDGSPLTVDDVVFSIDRHNDEQLASIVSAFQDVTSVEATGDDEVTITLKAPLAQFALAMTYAPIVKKAFVEDLGERFGGPGDDTVMGTGPYMVTDFQADTSVDLDRYADYWGDLPVWEKLSVVLIGDSQAAQLAMRADETDGAFSVVASEVETWRGIKDVTVEAGAALSPAFFAFDLRVEPWSDVHVRRAIAHSLDREGLVDSLLPGSGEPATSLVPIAQWAGLQLPDERVQEIYGDLASYEFDLDKAREELDQSAFADGFSATVEFGDAKPHLGRAAENLAQNLAEIGVQLEVKEVPLSQEIAAVTGHEGGFRILSFEGSDIDPADFPSFMLPSDFARPGGFNVPHYLNDRVDELLDLQAATADNEERATYLAELMKIISEDLPYLPVWWEADVVAFRNSLTYDNFHPLYFKKGIWPANVNPT